MQRSIPFGFNIESVAIRKAEIEASIYMASQISQMLKDKGVRKPAATQVLRTTT
jgi:vacuolar-type H+-ATPase catalytic subunit A/Vma1